MFSRSEYDYCKLIHLLNALFGKAGLNYDLAKMLQVTILLHADLPQISQRIIQKMILILLYVFLHLTFVPCCSVAQYLPAYLDIYLHNIYLPPLYFDIMYNPFFQSGWTITVDIVIGPRDGISYKAEQGSVVSFCFEQFC